MFKLKYLVLAFMLTVAGPLALQAPVQAAEGGAVIKALAKQFNVSPDLLQKFSKMGLSKVDLSNGLQLAKSIAGKGQLDISDAAEKVLGLKGEGKDWMEIAKEFDVELPDFSTGEAMQKLQKLSTD